MLKQYKVVLDDPFPDVKKDLIEDAAGIYFVFSAEMKIDVQKRSTSYVVQKLLYIGRAKNVNDRINGGHHKYQEIVDACRPPSVPLYYYGRVVDESKEKCTEADYVRVESALIYNKKPVLNETANIEFHHDMTIINLVRTEKTVNKNADTGAPSALPCAFGDDTFVVV